MKLNEFDTSNPAVKALKANFEYDLDLTGLSKAQTFTMLTKINKLIKEAKSRPDFYANQNNGPYMKLMFTAQALTEHYKNIKPARIIVENQEVEKSQTILAAQDMVDAVQKMIEEVNDMLVKELPALTDSIQSEIGVNESASFNQAASEALTTLNQTLSQSKQTLQNAMNQITGQGGDMAALGAPAAGGEEMAVTDIATKGAPGGGEEVVGATVGAEMPPAEEPEMAPAGGVGREKR